MLLRHTSAVSTLKQTNRTPNHSNHVKKVVTSGFLILAKYPFLMPTRLRSNPFIRDIVCILVMSAAFSALLSGSSIHLALTETYLRVSRLRTWQEPPLYQTGGSARAELSSLSVRHRLRSESWMLGRMWSRRHPLQWFITYSSHAWSHHPN